MPLTLHAYPSPVGLGGFLLFGLNLVQENVQVTDTNAVETEALTAVIATPTETSGGQAEVLSLAGQLTETNATEAEALTATIATPLETSGSQSEATTVTAQLNETNAVETETLRASIALPVETNAVETEALTATIALPTETNAAEVEALTATIGTFAEASPTPGESLSATLPFSDSNASELEALTATLSLPSETNASETEALTATIGGLVDTSASSSEALNATLIFNEVDGVQTEVVTPTIGVTDSNGALTDAFFANINLFYSETNGTFTESVLIPGQLVVVDSLFGQTELLSLSLSGLSETNAVTSEVVVPQIVAADSNNVFSESFSVSVGLSAETLTTAEALTARIGTFLDANATATDAITPTLSTTDTNNSPSENLVASIDQSEVLFSSEVLRALIALSAETNATELEAITAELLVGDNNAVLSDSIFSALTITLTEVEATSFDAVFLGLQLSYSDSIPSQTDATTLSLNVLLQESGFISDDLRLELAGFRDHLFLLDHASLEAQVVPVHHQLLPGLIPMVARGSVPQASPHVVLSGDLANASRHIAMRATGEPPAALSVGIVVVSPPTSSAWTTAVRALLPATTAVPSAPIAAIRIAISPSALNVVLLSRAVEEPVTIALPLMPRFFSPPVTFGVVLVRLRQV